MKAETKGALVWLGMILISWGLLLLVVWSMVKFIDYLFDLMFVY